jgi:PLP dependent protein
MNRPPTAAPDNGFAETVGRNIARVKERISDAGGDLASLRIIAVTKGFGPEAVIAAASHGVFDVGENYADELVEKASAISHMQDGQPNGGPITWHFQGALQTNKINRLKPFVTWWQSVDSVERLLALAVRAPGAKVLVQVDLSGSPGRSGCRPEEVAQIVTRAKDVDVSVLGVMGVAPIGSASLKFFETLAAIADRFELPERSMGMSDDLEDAVRAGATMVRVGSAVFGPRSQAGAAQRG